MILAMGEGLHLALGILAADLGNGEDRAVTVHLAAKRADEAGDIAVALVVQLELEIERAGARFASVGGGRIVGQFRIMHHEIDRIDAEAVDPAVEPEFRHADQCGLHLRVVPIELRLLFEEIMHIILAAPCVPRPGGAAEHRLPVAGGCAIGLGVFPDIPVGMATDAAGAAFHEPGMQVRCMGIDLIDQDFQAERMGAGDQRVEIGKRAKDRIDIAIIGNIIPEIAHRAGEEGGEPDGIDTEAGNIIEPRGDAGQIADAVVVRIGEAARIDLIDDRALPPWMGGGWLWTQGGL